MSNINHELESRVFSDEEVRILRSGANIAIRSANLDPNSLTEQEHEDVEALQQLAHVAASNANVALIQK